MCALQDCSSTPLLAARCSETKPSDLSSDSPAHSPNLITTGYGEDRYETLQAEEHLMPEPFTHDYLNRSDFVNIPSNYREKQHFKSKNIFHMPDTSSGLSPTLAEVDHLLPVKIDNKSQFMNEAENLVRHSSKKPFTQRSISDYYLSKRYEESKLLTPSAGGTEVKPNFQPCIHPSAESHKSFSTEYGNTNYNVLDNTNCCIPSSAVVPEEPKASSSQNGNPVPMDCEPGMSGFGQDILDDSKAEEKNSYKACNLNPTVNLKIFDTESLSESGDIGASNLATDVCAQRVLDEAWFIPSARHTFSGAELSGSASAAQLSIASSFGESNTPTCKICHMPAKAEDPLISPCRCTGTLHYIHCGCLMRWLEICNKRSRKPPACELCKYQFHWHKKFKVRHWQFPHCSWRDKILHTVFLISVLVMIGCAIVTVLCFRQHRGNKADITHLELSQSEIITLICGALFFLAFFLAMYVEIKARNTIYKLLVKFIYLNQQWYIDEYDKKGENTVIDV